MTLEELKAEAGRLGYYLVRKPVRPEPLLPCMCGCKRRQHCRFTHSQEVYLVCCNCGRAAKGLTATDARRNWNKMIRERRQDDKTTS